MEKTMTLSSFKIKLADVCIGIIYVAPLLVVLGPNFSYISSIIIISLSIILWRSHRFFRILPVFIFFSGQLMLPGDISAYRVFTFLLFLKLLYLKKPSIEKKHLLPLIITLLYGVAVVLYFDVTLSFIIIFEIVLILLYISMFIRKNFHEFFTYYVTGAVISCVFGWMMQERAINALISIDNEWVEVSRFLGSLPDPNYFGFFINIAIFSIILLNIFKNTQIKIVILILLYVSLFATLSITGILCNLLLLGIYFILSDQVKKKYVLTMLLVGTFLLLNVNTIANADYPVVSDVAKRIQSQLSFGETKDFSSLTSDRTDIWIIHFDYYLQQPVHKILFGGNYLTDYGFESKFKTVSHQAYIDMLLNFGLIGTLLMLFFFFHMALYYFKKFKIESNDKYLLLFIIKVIWVFYAFGLSMFPTWGFNLFFFL